MSKQEFERLLVERYPDLEGERVEMLSRYRDLVVEENGRQNLTRLVEPRDFVSGHIIDCVELLRSGLVSFPAVDLGSGAGVPGIPCAILGEGQWTLVESEKRKAEFLFATTTHLGIGDRVAVSSERIEGFLSKGVSVGSIVARAVGPVERVYEWIRKCSTWNSLVLLKGPGWGEEWSRFLLSSRRRELRIAGEHEYFVGEEKKRRLIVRIERVSRMSNHA